MNPQANGGPLPPPSPDPREQQTPAYGPPVSAPQPAPAMSGPEQSYAPEQQAAPAHESYEFIMNPQKPAKRWLPLPGNSSRMWMAITGAGIVVLIIIVAVILSSVFGNHTNFTPVVSVAQDQTELVRVAKLGTASATDSVAQNVAYTISLSMTSAQQQTVTYLANNHKKLGTKQLDLKQDNKTTTSLKSALATSTFDGTFMDDIQHLLSTYASDLNTAYKTNPGPKGRHMLINQYKDAQLLITQAKQPLAGS